MIPDQAKIWDKKHASGEHDSFRDKPSTLACQVLPYLPGSSQVLDLGCGTGRDAAFFDKNGHHVVATDLSSVAIKRDMEYYWGTGVTFKVLDMQKPFPFKNDSFDLIFMNLSLHYYRDETTKEIVREVARCLKSEGIFAFACKSVNDFHYGNGEEIEKNVFVSSKGHVRHLFTKDYARQVLGDLFQIESLREVVQEYSGEKSAIIECIARKTHDGSTRWIK